MTAVRALALGFLVLSCSGTPEQSAPLRVTATAVGPDTRLTLYAAPHLKVNARVAPALELGGGQVLRFLTGRRSADSAYFAEPPSALLPGRRREVHGTLRASVCRDDEQVCRTVAVEL